MVTYQACFLFESFRLLITATIFDKLISTRGSWRLFRGLTVLRNYLTAAGKLIIRDIDRPIPTRQYSPFCQWLNISRAVFDT